MTHENMSLQPPGHKSARIEELMDTLECPVCLDTADTAPVYQCPEGHLICKVWSQIQENVSHDECLFSNHD